MTITSNDIGSVVSETIKMSETGMFFPGFFLLTPGALLFQGQVTEGFVFGIDPQFTAAGKRHVRWADLVLGIVTDFEFSPDDRYSSSA